MKISTKGARRWFWWHKWTSLVCTLFLLLLCLTGLPLIFHHEIDELTGVHAAVAQPQAGQQEATISEMITNGLASYPEKVMRYVFWVEDEPEVVYLSLSDSLTAPPDNFKILRMDKFSGLEVGEFKAEGFMNVMLRLHVDMFAGIGGKLFLGLMGILFVVSIITGVVLYGPIMKKYDFGMIRAKESRRLKWLDTHNFLGIVALVWMTVVGITGIINTTSDIILYIWQSDQLTTMAESYPESSTSLPANSRYSIDKALEKAQNAYPEEHPSIIAMPGTAFSTKHHYAVLMRGSTPLTSRMLNPAFVDAQNGQLTIADAPWYVDTLLLSQPLHFGDYGGLPLKIIWALLDLMTIVILITGLYLWIRRFRSAQSMNIRLKEVQVKTKSLADYEKA